MIRGFDFPRVVATLLRAQLLVDERQGAHLVRARSTLAPAQSRRCCRRHRSERVWVAVAPTYSRTIGAVVVHDVDERPVREHGFANLLLQTEHHRFPSPKPPLAALGDILRGRPSPLNEQ